MLKVQFNGYERYKDSTNKHFQQRAARHQQIAYQAYAMIPTMDRFAPNGRVRRMVKELEQRWKHHFGEPSTFFKVQSRYTELKATWATLKEIIDPANRHIKIPPAKRYHYFGKDIKDDGSLPYRKEYLNEDPNYIRDMKIQAAEQSFLGVWHAAAQVLDYPDAKLHDVTRELRQDSSSLLISLAGRLREPNLDVQATLTELKEGITGLISKAIAAGEAPQNEIDFNVAQAKENLALLLQYYAEQVQGGDGLKKLFTHPPLRDLAKITLEVVSAIA